MQLLLPSTQVIFTNILCEIFIFYKQKTIFFFNILDCLEYMCRKLTMIVLDHQASISTLLDHILEIPATTATQVLRAILPLMRVSSSIRDNLIMVLRKALYRRGVQTRQMAVLGFLQLLKNLKLATLNALSQSDSSSSNAASSSSFFTQVKLNAKSKNSCNYLNDIFFFFINCRQHWRDHHSDHPQIHGTTPVFVVNSFPF